MVNSFSHVQEYRIPPPFCRSQRNLAATSALTAYPRANLEVTM
jgi:hypothetical protein